MINKEAVSVVDEFKTAHKELLQSIQESKYKNAEQLIKKQKSIVDKFFAHMKKECKID